MLTKKEKKRIYDRERYLRMKLPKEPRKLNAKYRFVNDGSGNGITAHKVIVEQVIGHTLPEGAQVHHIDGNGHNNSKDNLVVCPNSAYHMLLHRRQKALEECGHAGWFKCVFCKEYDAPENLHLYQPKDQTSPRANHSHCSTRYSAGRRKEVLVAEDCSR